MQSGNRATTTTIILGSVTAAAATLGFAILVNQVWEDYYITFRSSRNLVEGFGLVYQSGERVHTVTSPLGVLLPAMCYWISGSDIGALWLFRLISASFLASAAALANIHGREHGWPRLAAATVLCLGFMEAKIVAFSANGMETSILVFFAVLAWRELTRPGGMRWPQLAIGYAGMMWTRPDAFVLAGAITLAWWLFGPRGLGPSERVWWRRLLIAMCAGGIVYTPWFVWAWWYYGSPIPQTVVAKSIYSPEGFTYGRLLASPLRCLVDNTALDGLFLPIYYATGGWPRDLLAAGRLLARLSAFLWLLPFLPRPARAASFATLIGGSYFHQIMPYPWYYGPWTAIAAIGLASSVGPILERLTPTLRSTGRVLIGCALAGALLLTAANSYTCKVQQTVVENQGRKQIGLWLKEHAAPTDTVFLEPIGYIGYFSGLKILDFPGLTAPEVSREIAARGPSYPLLIDALKPDWIVVRPIEYSDQSLSSETLPNYVRVADWNVRPTLDTHRILPGRSWPEFDSEFIILRRLENDPTVNSNHIRIGAD